MIKRRRDSSDDELEDANAKILLMEQGILESKKNYNDITILLGTAGEFKKGKPESMLAAVALCRIFVRLLAQGSLVLKKSTSERETVVVTWLRDQLYQYKSLLESLLQDDELGSTSLTLSMRILKAEGEVSQDKEDYEFPQAALEAIVAKILMIDNEDVRQAFIEEYVEQYDDIRFFTFKSIRYVTPAVKPVSVTKLTHRLTLERLGENGTTDGLFDRAFSLMSVLDGVPASADELEDFYVLRPKKKTHKLRSVAQHKRQGQEAWLAVMKVAESKDHRKRILGAISKVIAPWFTKPELLSDFLTNSYDAGGSISLLALSGVFYLIQERNLDYPSFYPKLYSLLDRQILHSKHRSNFFRLLDTFLASTHLPATLVASFIKRISRLTINAPPSAIVFVIPWIYNLLKRHPLCTFLVHRETRDIEMKKLIREQGVEDPFLPEESDPMKTNAIDSGLWELVQLQSHYHPNVATVAKIICEQFTKQSYNMEDFLDHSYASVS